jgi:hypothetical protein
MMNLSQLSRLIWRAKFPTWNADLRTLRRVTWHITLPARVVIHLLANLPFRRKYRLAIVTVVKNEARDILEWLSVHRMLGADRFLVFDDGSDDGLQELLQPWISAGLLEILAAGQRSQLENLRLGLRRLRWSADWVAFLDADEFLWSPAEDSLLGGLNKMGTASSIFVPWQLFGSNGHSDHPRGRGVLETYTACLPYEDAIGSRTLSKRRQLSRARRGDVVTGDPLQGKLIVNPRRVFRVSGLHQVILWVGSTQLEDGAKWTYGAHLSYCPRLLMINHYWSKSIADLRRKAAAKELMRHRLGQTSSSEDFFDWEAELCRTHDSSLYYKVMKD